MEKFRANLMLCAGTGCIASGTLKVSTALKEEIKRGGLKMRYRLS